VTDAVEIGLQAGDNERISIGKGRDHLSEANLLRLSGENGQVQPAIRRPCGMVAQKDGIVAILLGEKTAPNNRRAGVSLAVRGDKLKPEPDSVPERRNPWMTRLGAQVNAFLIMLKPSVAYSHGIAQDLQRSAEGG
jgi:hypothetical protein